MAHKIWKPIVGETSYRWTIILSTKHIALFYSSVKISYTYIIVYEDTKIGEHCRLLIEIVFPTKQFWLSQVHLRINEDPHNWHTGYFASVKIRPWTHDGDFFCFLLLLSLKLSVVFEIQIQQIAIKFCGLGYRALVWYCLRQ